MTPATPRLFEAARDRMVAVHGATLVVVYGSFASGTADGASDLDLVAFAPVPAPFHDTTPLAGRDLDAWVYPLGHPFSDPELVRVHPALALHDPEARFPAFEAAVAQTRAEAHRPWDEGARADLAAWVAKMVVRARTPGPEGLYRWHWLVFEGPELWCRFRGLPWEGPKKALARMAAKEPGTAAAYAQLLAGPPDPGALEAWCRTVVG